MLLIMHNNGKRSNWFMDKNKEFLLDIELDNIKYIQFDINSNVGKLFKSIFPELIGDSPTQIIFGDIAKSLLMNCEITQKAYIEFTKSKQRLEAKIKKEFLDNAVNWVSDMQLLNLCDDYVNCITVDRNYFLKGFIPISQWFDDRKQLNRKNIILNKGI